MSEDNIFELIEQSINMGAEKLRKEQTFKPYALTLSSNNETCTIERYQEDDDLLYEEILLHLKDSVTCKDIEVIAIVALVDIAEHYKSEHERAIRVHIEQKSLVDEKVGGKFIYAPYQIFDHKGDMHVELHPPFSVGFIAEVFTK